MMQAGSLMGNAAVTIASASDQPSLPDAASAFRVLIVDDHQMIREIMFRYLAEIGNVAITEAHDFVSAFTAIAQDPGFDLVLLDIRMPGVDGFTALATFRRLFPQLRVAVLSGSVDLADVRRAAESGAVGYLPKSMDHLPLIHALRLILSGGQFYPAQMVRQTESDIYPQAIVARALADPAAIELTSRQKTVLQELAKGLSNREIGNALGISEITVKIHVHSICQKLAVRNRVQAVQRGRSLGLLID
jgi:two-component system nitrate/nitrite response regulator NarL